MLGDLQVSALGFGAWALTGTYGEVSDAQAIAVINRALDLGVTMVDTADAYGRDGHNEKLVGRAIAGRRHEVVVATKWGIAPGEHASLFEHNFANDIWIDARAERARPVAEESLCRLGIDAIDLWYLHFPDPGRPIEETVGAMAELVSAGLVRHLGLSNVTPEQLRRAHAVHPIAAVQNEYSLWTRLPEHELLVVARQLGIGFVAWGPLGLGFLAGDVELTGELDVRRHGPRFQPESLRSNVDRFAPFRRLAAELGITPAQLALAWLLHQGDDVVPIPGTRSLQHLDANIAALEIELDPATLERIDELAPPDLAHGEALIG
jgi:aryl-alcohol dehydrogenase-like predicted oxidoreductase